MGEMHEGPRNLKVEALRMKRTTRPHPRACGLPPLAQSSTRTSPSFAPPANGPRSPPLLPQRIVLAARARGARVSPQRKKVEAKEGVVRRQNRVCEACKGARGREGM